MSENKVNSYKSRRIVAVTDTLMNSRYRSELRGFGFAGGKTEARAELTNREYLEENMLASLADFDFHYVKQFERIDRLAFNYLGDSRLWWVIAELNSDVIKDPLILPVGTYIKIPTVEIVQRIMGS